MGDTDFAAQYGELDGLFKNFYRKKKKETKLLRKKLGEEVATNIELRKYIALLQSKLAQESDNAAELERLYQDSITLLEEEAKKHSSKLCTLASELSSRLLMVDRRERECAERAAALALREDAFWLRLNNFESNRAEFEAGLSACKKALSAELQYSREAVDAAKGCLCDIRDKDQQISVKAQELDDEAFNFYRRVRLELDERSLRDRTTSYEFEARCSLLTSFFHVFNLQVKQLLAQNDEKLSQLKSTTDLLLLHEVEFSTRVRKEKDLCRDERSRVELLRREFALECKNVLRNVTDLLDSISSDETEALRTNLESKLHAMLHQSHRPVR